MQSDVKNALSVDLEDWHHGVLQINYKDWHRYENRLKQNLTELLNLLKRNQVKATFFVLGYIAEKFPEFVSKIAQEGHELASHGYCHRPIFEQSPEEFKEDALRSKEVLESITNIAIEGYRAPFFSITEKSLWALEILKDLGFKYDSSIFPTKNFLYGIPNCPQAIHKVAGDALIEFPLSVIKRWGLTIPISGGFYMRMFPYKLLKLGLSSFNQGIGPAIIYLHPWELDQEKPKINMSLPLKWKIIYEGNIKTMKKKLKQLLQDFEFTTISEVLFGA